MRRGGYRGNSHAASRGRSFPYYGRPAATALGSQQAEPCAIYTRTGRCDQIKSCRYRHDPDRTALCQQFLKTGRCTKAGGERCYLSHKPRPENTPMCKHFARGNCNNANCQFAHMTNLGNDPDSTPVCRTFALNGWCDRELRCPKRHSFDCPDFETHGSCANPKCTLQHVIKAANKSVEGRPLNTKDAVSLSTFINFLETVDRKTFDSRTHHSTPTSLEPSTNEAEELAESDEDSDEDSDLNFEQEDAETQEDIDMNADFIKV